MTDYLSGCVISSEPTVILSSSINEAVLGIASVAPELFRHRPSLHLIKPSTSLAGKFKGLAKELAQAAVELPKAAFVVLANEEWELVELQAHNIPAIVANNFILIDENTFYAFDQPAREYDAIYNAMFRALKNHQLCAHIPSLALIHYPMQEFAEEDYERDIRALLKHAAILNEPGGAPYRRMSQDEVAAAINTAHVGLCLSAKEGAMRACGEFLACGIPVVTVPALGGRMRYLNLANSRTVPPDATAVAAAVAELKSLHLDPQDIRNEFLSIVDFERRNFLAYLNAAVERQFGVRNHVKNFAALRGAAQYKPISLWKEWLAAA